MYIVGYFVLRVIFVFWLSLLFGLLFPTGELSIRHVFIVVLISVFLFITKYDIKLVTNFIKWNWSAFFVRAIYALLWIWVIVHYNNSNPFGRGLWLMYATFVIAPISEIFIAALFLLTQYIIYPISLESKELFYIELFFSVALSFIVLELLLRFTRKKLTKSVDI